MPLGIRIRGAGACPVIICDYCNQVIEHARDGLFRWPQDMQQEEIAPMEFTHAICNTDFIETHGGMQAWVWNDMNLDVLPVHLLHNLGLTWKEASKKATMWANLGR